MSSYTLVNVACTFFSSIIIILIRTQITHTEQKQNFLQKQKKNKKNTKKIQKKYKKKQKKNKQPFFLRSYLYLEQSNNKEKESHKKISKKTLLLKYINNQ